MIHEPTIATYNKSAKKLAVYFAGIGPRISLIEKGLALAESPLRAHVVEVGCGDGRDATEIVKRVALYEGFDPSIGLIQLAKQRLPHVRFTQADALNFAYPPNIDVVYAFASFLHLNKDDFAVACKRAATALRPGGVLLVTLKERESYQSELVVDEFGERLFYYYNEAIIRTLIDETRLKVAYIEREHHKNRATTWLLLGFVKH